MLSFSSSSTIHFLVHSKKLSLMLTVPVRVPLPWGRGEPPTVV